MSFVDNLIINGGFGDSYFPSSGLGGEGFLTVILEPDKTLIDVEDEVLQAIIISLYSDLRYAFKKGEPPIPGDRRGWWGDNTSSIAGDKIGSGLWNFESAPITDSIIDRIRKTVKDSLSWMLSDLVASRVDVSAERDGTESIKIGVIIHKNNESLPAKYFVVWDMRSGSVSEYGSLVPEQNKIIELSSSSSGELYLNGNPISIVSFDDQIAESIFVSLFSDGRYGAAIGSDKRGWWGSVLPGSADASFGCTSWLIEKGVMTDSSISWVRDSIKKSLAWLVSDRIVQSFDVILGNEGAGSLSAKIKVFKPNSDSPSYYNLSWNKAA